MTNTSTMPTYKLKGVDFIPLYGVWNYIKRNENPSQQTQEFVGKVTLLQLYNAALLIGGMASWKGLEKIIQQYMQ